MTLTAEHDTKRNRLKIVTDKTVEHLDFEEANDFLTDLMDVVQKIEEREIELDNIRFADEYGYAAGAWTE